MTNFQIAITVFQVIWLVAFFIAICRVDRNFKRREREWKRIRPTRADLNAEIAEWLEEEVQGELDLSTLSPDARTRFRNYIKSSRRLQESASK